MVDLHTPLCLLKGIAPHYPIVLPPRVTGTCDSYTDFPCYPYLRLRRQLERLLGAPCTLKWASPIGKRRYD